MTLCPRCWKNEVVEETIIGKDGLTCPRCGWTNSKKSEKGDRMDEQKAKDIVSLMNFEAMKMMAGFHMLRTSGMKFTGLAFRDQNEGCKYVVHVDIDTEEGEE